jgi:hypothetical protein
MSRNQDLEVAALPRGGDRRRILRPEGRDLSYASLLMQAMCEDTSEAGIRFNHERERLYQRWERLVRALVHLDGGEVTFSIAAASGNMAKMIYEAEDREVGNGGGAV